MNDVQPTIAPPTTARPTLTDRERQILDLIWASSTNKMISEKLGLAIKTVEGHRYRLYKKFDAVNSIGAVRQALKLGLLTV